MQRTISKNDIQLLAKSAWLAGMTISASPDSNAINAIECFFINNPDGTLRWIWPTDSRSAAFLKFYHKGSLKARIAATLMSLACKTGLARLAAHGRQKIYVCDKTISLLNSLYDWAIFTGTVGENRKLIAWSNSAGRSLFAKVPLTLKAQENLGNEVVGMTMQEQNITTAKTTVINDCILLQEDIYTGSTRSAKNIFALPASQVINWSGKDLSIVTIANTQWWIDINTRLKNIIQKSSRFSPAMIQRIQDVRSSINPFVKMHIAPSHGDFTPWNIRVAEDRLAMIDWELYAPARPALYDAFHFIYQQNVLIAHARYAKIKSQIEEYFCDNRWLRFINDNRIDMNLCEKLYLLDVATYYMDVYSRQDKWHIQVDWLLQTWCEALGNCLIREQQISARTALLQDINQHLQHKSYAILKLGSNDIATLPATSDIDMCISKKEAQQLVRYIAEHSATSAVKTTKLSFMSRLSVISCDRSLLYIDMISKLKRRNLSFMNAQHVMDTAITNPYGTKVAIEANDREYIQAFHFLNGADVPHKYAALFEHDTQAMQHSKTARSHMQTELKKAKENKGFNKIRNTISYTIDTLRLHMPKRGMVITFSGVDGAGKSTVINNIAYKIEKELRTPVVVLRHRPSILPILSAWKYGKKEAEMRSVSKLPRTGNNTSGISSYLRFIYYYSDYLLGQFYIQFRYVYQGHTVLYDRYYFDFINDARRSNISIPESVTRKLYRFLLKPDLNYFLFAPSDVILKRKQELDETTIKELTGKYRLLFDKLGKQDRNNGYHSVCNIDLNDTLDRIFVNIKQNKLCA